jgi:flagellar biogenesis protein FliO
MYQLVTALCLLTYSLLAQAALQFKNDIGTSTHWLPYIGVLLILLTVSLFLAKYSSKNRSKNSKANILETIPIHYKTKAYVIEYQGQRFLIADNQNAIAIQALNHEVSLS